MKLFKKKKDKLEKDTFDRHVTINMNTFQFCVTEKEKLSEITAKILEDLPQVKESYDVKNDEDRIITNAEYNQSYKAWESDITKAATVVMELFQKQPVPANLEKCENVLIDETGIRFHK